MKQFNIPYGKGNMPVEVPEQNLLGVLDSKVNSYGPSHDEADLVQLALQSPIESLSLAQIVQDKKNVVIITSDHTRPVPSSITLPILLSHIRKYNSNIDIAILVATGFHRVTTQAELLEKFGTEIVEQERIILHDSRDDDAMVHLGILPSGGALWVNRIAAEADCLIAEGFIEPHFFAGFSGGRKSVLPGIAGYQTVLANHCSEFIASDFARTGILNNNPIHKDMVSAAETIGLIFILNVVLNEKREIIYAVAGDPFKAHETGCRFLKDLARVKTDKADIVITSNGGYPLDQNIYQTVKGMSTAESCCREGGVIIILSECGDGHGGESFYRNMTEASSPDEVLERVLKIPRDQTVPDQWEFQILARILQKHTVILVSDCCDAEMVRNMHLQPATSAEEALNMAFASQGEDASVVVIPDGVGVIVGLND